MKDLSNPENELASIIPPAFHSEFKQNFLQMKLKDVAPLMESPTREHQPDIDKLKKTYELMTYFLMDPCRRTQWCPPNHRNNLKGFLDTLDR